MSELYELAKKTSAFDMMQIRQEFPILSQRMRGKPLVYLDSGATTQKPGSVIKAIHDFYAYQNANIHRGIYQLSENATLQYEAVREKVRKFINAKMQDEIIFVKGTTEGINLVAQTYGRTKIKAGDEILISHMEHHSNIVPWKILAEQVGAHLKIIPITEDGAIDLEIFKGLLSERTKLLALTHVSNVLGTINPVKKMIQYSHEFGVPVLLDGAQAIGHMSVDVQALDCDFYVFSAHKMYGPTGVGVLYGKKHRLDELPPYQGGGDMINSVSFDEITYQEVPHRFEAGTPNISGVIGMGAALDFLETHGMDNISKYEHSLTQYAREALSEVEGLRLYGPVPQRAGIFSFTLSDIHPHDIGTILDNEGIAIRAGHHCAMPLMHYFKVPAMARASLAIYNTHEDIDALINALKITKRMFA